jgi:hypothetical protein
MANLIWTGILYFSTLSIVFITYRTFVNDRKADNERQAQDIVARAQSRMRGSEQAPVQRRTARRPVAVGQPTEVPVAR